MSGIHLKLGTRGSRLALIQTNMVRDTLVAALQIAPSQIEIVVFETRGDLKRDCTIEEVGGRGIFTDELDQAVLNGDIDAAVHSVKDLPVALNSGLRLAATLEREDPREAFVSSRYAKLADVPAQGVFGTASVRRAALLRAVRPNAQFALLRGNVDERVAALAGPDYDGTILAVAGLKRLGLAHHIRETLAPDVLMPDPGQGAIGIVARATDGLTRTALARINHQPTYVAVLAERAVLATAGGQAIVGALATVDRDAMTLQALAADESGAQITRETVTGEADQAEALGVRMGALLLSRIEQARRA